MMAMGFCQIIQEMLVLDFLNSVSVELTQVAWRYKVFFVILQFNVLEIAAMSGW
jgi:hypothetical protein